MTKDKLSGRMLAGLAIFTAAVGLVGWTIWHFRPFFHGLAMWFYHYPLLTWMPFVAFLVLTAVIGSVFYFFSRDVAAYGPGAFTAGVITFLVWVVCCVFIGPWQGRATYEANRSLFSDNGVLPQETQPRILPKAAASEFGEQHDLKHAHLAVNPGTGDLTWTAERSPGGLLSRGKSEQIASMPLSHLDGRMEMTDAGFATALSQMGTGSLKWRAYKDDYFTDVSDPIIVPMADGKFVAVAPYIGYKGFFVKRPYWKGVHVLHQDGRLETLTPEQAAARPELAASGRLVPEEWARTLANAYGYKNGVANAIPGGDHRDQTQVSDPEGNPQPYLTKLDDDRIVWVTVAHPYGDENRVSAVFITDTATARTSVWHAPQDRNLLSNQGAINLTYQNVDVDWTRTDCCTSDGYNYEVTLRTAEEPRPVFADGRFYYLVSVLPNRYLIKGGPPVEKTVLVDASERSITKVFDHAEDPNADSDLRLFFSEGVLR
jgi:hypothetical protein